MTGLADDSAAADLQVVDPGIGGDKTGVHRGNNVDGPWPSSDFIRWVKGAKRRLKPTVRSGGEELAASSEEYTLQSRQAHPW